MDGGAGPFVISKVHVRAGRDPRADLLVSRRRWAARGRPFVALTLPPNCGGSLTMYVVVQPYADAVKRVTEGIGTPRGRDGGRSWYLSTDSRQCAPALVSRWSAWATTPYWAFVFSPWLVLQTGDDPRSGVGDHRPRRLHRRRSCAGDHRAFRRSRLPGPPPAPGGSASVRSWLSPRPARVRGWGEWYDDDEVGHTVASADARPRPRCLPPERRPSGVGGAGHLVEFLRAPSSGSHGQRRPAVGWRSDSRMRCS